MDAGLSNIMGQYERELEAQGYKPTGEQKTLGKNDFLKLLVTQLEHQDPLKPMDDKEFIAQLAQFSSLEQMNNVASGLDKLVEMNKTNQMLGAVSFIGKEVTASGDSISKQGDVVSSAYYTLSDNASSLYVNVLDRQGNIIYSANLGAVQQGSYEFNWNGQDFNGAEAPDGVYRITFRAEGEHGESVEVQTRVSGKVLAIENNADGPVLKLDDGRTVKFQDVQEVVQTQTGEQSAQQDNNNGDGEQTEQSTDGNSDN